MSLADDILGINDHQSAPVEVPEWGRTLYVKSLTVDERLKVQKHFHDRSKFLGLVVVECVTDQDGNRVFSDEHIPALLKKNGAILERLFLECLKVNGMGGDAVKQAKND